MNWKKIGIGAGGVATAAFFLSLMSRWDHLQLGIFILTLLVALGDAYCLKFAPRPTLPVDHHLGADIPTWKKWQTVRLCTSIALGFLAIFILQVGHMLGWDNTKEKWLILVALLAFVAARLFPYFRRTVGAFENAHSQGLEDGKIRVYERGFHFVDPLRETFKDADIVSTEQTKLDIDAKTFDTADARVVFSGHVPYKVDPSISHKRIGVEEEHINRMITDSAISSIREVVGTKATTALIKESTAVMTEVNLRFTMNSGKSRVEDEYGLEVGPIQGSFERTAEVFKLALAEQEAGILERITRKMKKLVGDGKSAGELAAATLPNVRFKYDLQEKRETGHSVKEERKSGHAIQEDRKSGSTATESTSNINLDAEKTAKAITDGIAKILGKS